MVQRRHGTDQRQLRRQELLLEQHLTRRQFYERLPGWPTPPTTSAPGVDVFRLAYERLAADDNNGGGADKIEAK